MLSNALKVEENPIYFHPHQSYQSLATFTSLANSHTFLFKPSLRSIYGPLMFLYFGHIATLVVSLICRYGKRNDDNTVEKNKKNYEPHEFSQTKKKNRYKIINARMGRKIEILCKGPSYILIHKI